MCPLESRRLLEDQPKDQLLHEANKVLASLQSHSGPMTWADAMAAAKSLNSLIRQAQESKRKALADDLIAIRDQCLTIIFKDVS